MEPISRALRERIFEKVEKIRSKRADMPKENKPTSRRVNSQLAEKSLRSTLPYAKIVVQFL